MSFPIQMQVTRDGVVTVSMQQAPMWQAAGLNVRGNSGERTGTYVHQGEVGRINSMT